MILFNHMVYTDVKTFSLDKSHVKLCLIDGTQYVAKELKISNSHDKCLTFLLQSLLQCCNEITSLDNRFSKLFCRYHVVES